MNGFNVAPHTKVCISIQTPQPRPEVVKVVKEVWNNHPDIQMMKDYVNEIFIDRAFWDDPTRYIGEWWTDNRFVIRDNISHEPTDFEAVTIHEIVGHAFFHWAEKNRPNELRKFIELADKTPPITDYIKKFETDWRKEDPTLYANEQHSAIAEWINNAPSYHKYLIKIPDELIQLYRELHGVLC